MREQIASCQVHPKLRPFRYGKAGGHLQYLGPRTARGWSRWSLSGNDSGFLFWFTKENMGLFWEQLL